MTNQPTCPICHNAGQHKMDCQVASYDRGLRTRIEELEALASQINTDWIPANQRLSRRILELQSGLSEALYMLGAIDVDGEPTEAILDTDPDAVKPGIRRAYKLYLGITGD